MRISVNLATRPFVELRSFFLRLRIVMAVLVVVGIGAAIAAHSMQKKLNLAAAQMDSLRQRTNVFAQEKHANEARMREPANAAVLDRSHFLNALFLRKSFSWTAVLMDLENVLPLGVEVTSIKPEIAKGGDVVIRLRVSGERERAVQLVRNLEHSRRFLQPRLSGEVAEAKDANGAVVAAGVVPGVEFEILATYNPIPEGEPYTEEKGAAAEAGGAAAGPTAARSMVAVPRGRVMERPGGPTPRYGVVLKPYAARPNVAVSPSRVAPPRIGQPGGMQRPGVPNQFPGRPVVPQRVTPMGQGGPR